MNIKICNKCGDKINTNPMTNAIFPMLSIRRWDKDGFTMGWTSVDLCPKCEKMLAEWLNDHSTEGADERR